MATLAVSPCADCTALCCKKLIIEIEHADVKREPLLASVAVKLKGPDKLYRLACGSPCALLTVDNKCSIYATRPVVCRAFEPGGEQCNELRTEAGLPNVKK